LPSSPRLSRATALRALNGRMIIGIAGHADYGKTAPAKALTGIDADRLAEEKRAITIPTHPSHLPLPP
jgi:translation initiation factor 2 gamma subunit (eIF-2gamma)